MGNSFGCSASGERLVSAARDGDFVEAKMLLDCNPCLSKYSTFGGLNSPLHFAAAKGHNEVSIFAALELFEFSFRLLIWTWLRILFVGFTFDLNLWIFGLLDCGIVAREWGWCEFKELLWTGKRNSIFCNFWARLLFLVAFFFFFFKKWWIFAF